jgi:hypothetical protein
VTPEAADGAYYSSLTRGAEYEVIGIECDSLRLVDDRGEPVLFDPTCFQVTDASEPADWVSFVDEGVRYAYPPRWGRPGFFEDWHDGVADVRRQFSEERAQRASRPSN